jgi:hypothetical protein
MLSSIKRDTKILSLIFLCQIRNKHTIDAMFFLQMDFSSQRTSQVSYWMRSCSRNSILSEQPNDSIYLQDKVLTFGLIKKVIFQNSQFFNDDWLIVVCLLFNAHRQIFRAFSWLVKVQQYLESNLQECREQDTVLMHNSTRSTIIVSVLQQPYVLSPWNRHQ